MKFNNYLLLVVLTTVVGSTLAASSQSQSEDDPHYYEEGSLVPIWVKSLAPRHNRQATYAYDSIMCVGASDDNEQSTTSSSSTSSSSARKGAVSSSLSDSLLGIQWVNLGLNKLRFPSPVAPDDEIEIKGVQRVPLGSYCSLPVMNVGFMSLLQNIVAEEFIETGSVDGLLYRTSLGQVVPSQIDESVTFMLFRNKHFDISYNGNRIINVNVTNNDPVLLNLQAKYPTAINMTYSVSWRRTSATFEQRLEALNKKQQLQTYSLVFSILCILGMIGIVVFILYRSLSKDYARYNQVNLDEFASPYN